MSARFTNPVENRARRPFGPVKGVKFVTEHCCTRFRERNPDCSAISEGQLVIRLENWLTKAREVVTTPKQNLNEILNHLRPAKFYRIGGTSPGNRLVNNDWVLVVEGDTMVTVYHYKKPKGQANTPPQKAPMSKIREVLIASGRLSTSS